MHSTDNLENGYFGSGQRLWKSIRKHGKEKHAKEILEFLPNRKMLSERERELVNPDRLRDPLCLNLALGGFDSTRNQGKRRTAESSEKARRSMGTKHHGSGNPNYGSRWVTNGIEEQKFSGTLQEGWRFGRLDTFGSSRGAPPNFIFISPTGKKFKGHFGALCETLNLNPAKMHEFTNRGPIPLSATRIQTRKCVGWEAKKGTI